MTRRCSHCSNNGHNSRTCPTRSAAPTGGGGGGSGVSSSSLAGVRLFGVRLTDGSIIKKSASMGNLSAHYHSSSAASNNPDSPLSDHARDSGRLASGYLSDDPAHGSSSNRRGDRKKGVPWTEEEHRLFLIGLQKLGKGDWRGIARNYVVSRTPTQVASHAQKYFIRQSNASRRKRRSSLFDMVTDGASSSSGSHKVPEDKELPRESNNADIRPSLNLSLKPEYEPMETTSEEPAKEEQSNEIGTGLSESIAHVPRPTQFRPLASSSSEFAPFVHQFMPVYAPMVPYHFWPANAIPVDGSMVTETSNHAVLRPVAVVPKQPVNVDELVGISNLSIGEPAPLSLKLSAEASRHSAFQANAAPVSRPPDIGKGKGSPIQAV